MGEDVVVLALLDRWQQEQEGVVWGGWGVGQVGRDVLEHEHGLVGLDADVVVPRDVDVGVSGRRQCRLLVAGLLLHLHRRALLLHCKSTNTGDLDI